jgi:hypothetical protein
VFALMATLTLLVSRRRSKIAMWISILLFIGGLPPDGCFARRLNG